MTRQPAFFVQNNYVSKLTIPVAQYAHARGYCLIDRSTHAAFDPMDCDVDWSPFNPVIAYGSVQFLRKLKEAPALAPYILHDEQQFSYARWVQNRPNQMLNREGQLLSAAGTWELLQVDGLRHVRPDHRDKAFVARVFNAGEWGCVCATRELAPDLDCWVSPLKPVRSEWRCWVIGNEVVEISSYRLNEEPHRARENDSRVWQQAQEFANGWLPAPCVVMDIADVDGQLEIVEFNPIHTCGWYAAEVSIVLDAWCEWMRRTYR